MSAHDTDGDPEGDAARDRFAALLDRAASEDLQVPFWWRDDDAQDVTPALDQLVTLSARHGVPLALAVIPKGATEGLAEMLGEAPQVAVLQHGWQHASHALAGEKKIELDGHRPLDTVLDELTHGRMRLQALFPQTFHLVLVPPWNRIAERVRAARRDAGLFGLSTFGAASGGDPQWVNTHLDIMDWKARASLPRAAAYAVLCGEMERRLDGDTGPEPGPEPLGILTHHLVHQDASWDFLEELFALTAKHPAAAWPAVPELFALKRSWSLFHSD